MRAKPAPGPGEQRPHGVVLLAEDRSDLARRAPLDVEEPQRAARFAADMLLVLFQLATRPRNLTRGARYLAAPTLAREVAALRSAPMSGQRAVLR